MQTWKELQENNLFLKWTLGPDTCEFGPFVWFISQEITQATSSFGFSTQNSILEILETWLENWVSRCKDRDARDCQRTFVRYCTLEHVDESIKCDQSNGNHWIAVSKGALFFQCLERIDVLPSDPSCVLVSQTCILQCMWGLKVKTFWSTYVLQPSK